MRTIHRLALGPPAGLNYPQAAWLAARFRKLLRVRLYDQSPPARATPEASGQQLKRADGEVAVGRRSAAG